MRPSQTIASAEREAALADENDKLREAMRRLREWGGYSEPVANAVMDWWDAGARGPLPALPAYALDKPTESR